MSERGAKEVRRAQATAAALMNEQLTRARVASLEQVATAVLAILSRGIFGRLKWLVFGR